MTEGRVGSGPLISAAVPEKLMMPMRATLRPGWALAARDPARVPEGEAADERAPVESFSSPHPPAASSDGGIASPSAFAALRLITSSNFDGCSTGSSAGLGALQDLVDEDRRAPPDLEDVRAIADESTGLDVFGQVVHDRESAPRGQLCDLPGAAEEQARGDQEQAACARVGRRLEGAPRPRWPREPRASGASIPASAAAVSAACQ